MGFYGVSMGFYGVSMGFYGVKRRTPNPVPELNTVIREFNITLCEVCVIKNLRKISTVSRNWILTYMYIDLHVYSDIFRKKKGNLRTDMPCFSRLYTRCFILFDQWHNPISVMLISSKLTISISAILYEVTLTSKSDLLDILKKRAR